MNEMKYVIITLYSCTWIINTENFVKIFLDKSFVMFKQVYID